MNDLMYTIEDNKLFESIADIAFMAGQRGFCSGDSRTDVAEFIQWGKEFESVHEDTDWDEMDYVETIEAFMNTKLRIELQVNREVVPTSVEIPGHRVNTKTVTIDTIRTSFVG